MSTTTASYARDLATLGRYVRYLTDNHLEPSNDAMGQFLDSERGRPDLPENPDEWPAFFDAGHGDWEHATECILVQRMREAGESDDQFAEVAKS